MNSLSNCPLCSNREDSLSHLFFRCCFARILWRLSPWPLDSAVFHFHTMVDWIKVILFPDKYLQIPQTDLHYFQIFASVASDLLWTHRNKAFHEGSSFDALTLSCTVNKVALDHYRAWKVLNSAPSLEKWIPLILLISKSILTLLFGPTSQPRQLCVGTLKGKFFKQNLSSIFHVLRMKVKL